jgi:hypothetical protein
MRVLRQIVAAKTLPTAVDAPRDLVDRQLAHRAVDRRAVDCLFEHRFLLRSFQHPGEQRAAAAHDEIVSPAGNGADVLVRERRDTA